MNKNPCCVTYEVHSVLSVISVVLIVISVVMLFVGIVLGFILTYDNDKVFLSIWLGCAAGCSFLGCVAMCISVGLNPETDEY